MRDEITNKVVGIFSDAFKMRDVEKTLSVNWLEYFPGSKVERLQKVREHSELDLGNNYGFAVLNVGTFSAACESVHGKVRVIYEPTTDPSHAAMHRYPREHDELFAILANIAKNDFTLIRDLPEPS
jgi:hypothetical protein